MLILSGVCAILAILSLITNLLTGTRRRVFAVMEFSATLLLLFDRFAYQYRGDVSTTGYWMVRISNFAVYFLTLMIMHEITLYVFDLLRYKGEIKKMPARLYLCEALFSLGVIMLIVSQFTGLYYKFDEFNRYQRSDWNVLCFVLPLAISFIHISSILQYRRQLSRRITFSLVLTTVVPIAASVVQIFVYGVSLANIALCAMLTLLFVYAIIDLNEEVEKARNLEILFYREEQQKEHALFEQTARALVNAIDAKDKYTQGHSRRVAEYSEKIARAAGKSEEFCDEVYFTALLHDVGKIGIKDSIINKEGKLTDQEYSIIKQHPGMGSQILSSIEQSPFLSDGANYHHERYDGKGYPRGLHGDQIPEIARIIAVADAYDAMTSKRSYRDPLPQSAVRAEFVEESGRQFDPEYADIMVRLMDADKDFTMREGA